MPVEFLGMVATQQLSETRGSLTERAIDPGFLAEFAQAHEQSGFDRALICYGASHLHIGHPEQFRRFTAEVLPRLRDRGIAREEYASTTLRGNLGLPIPENRRTAARRQAVFSA